MAENRSSTQFSAIVKPKRAQKRAIAPLWILKYVLILKRKLKKVKTKLQEKDV